MFYAEVYDTRIWSSFCVFGRVPVSVMSRAIFDLQVNSTGYCFCGDPSHLAYMLSCLLVLEELFSNVVARGLFFTSI